MFIKTPEILKWEEFYKINIVEANSYNYSLNKNELRNFGYNQYFINDLKGVVLTPSSINDDATVNKQLLLKYNPDLVYTNPGKGGAFGDSLGWISFICRLSEASGKKIKLVRLPGTCENIKKNILSTTGEHEIVKTNKIFYLPGGTKGGYREVYSKLYLPSKVPWAATKEKIAGYQFGKRGMGDRRVQDPKDEMRMVKALAAKGYQIKEIGGALGDEGCMKAAAECQFFVGTCSGMSHLCHSVGTPVHMITNLRSLERVSAGHVKNTRSEYPTIFWQHPNHFIEYVEKNL